MLPRPSRHSTVGVLLMLALAFGVGAARTATPPPPAERIYDMQWLDINKWYCPFYNDGRYALDITIGTGEAGGSWPQPYLNKYIFGAGLWFGTLKPRADDPEKVDTLVTFGYNPNSGGTEMTPTDAAHASEGAGNTQDRIYRFPDEWPPPLSRFTTEGWRFGANRRDTIEAELVPQENFSLQDMWCVYCDLGEDNHVSPGQPQGIEVYQTVYAWNYPSNEDIFFIIYKMRNATDVLLGGEGVTLRRCFAGALMDPDIGAHADDMVGLLLDDSVAMPTGDTVVVQNVGFAGDDDNHEVPNARGQWENEDIVPGVVAYKFLESPLKDSTLPSGEDTLVQLGMTSFKKFTIDIDPVTDPTQYLTMAGFDYRTGVLSNYDSLDESPADKRFVQCSGPFDLAPGQVEILTVACIAAMYGVENQTWEERRTLYNDTLWQLAAVANNAQFIYDQGWLLPGPPPSPNITLVPGDNSIRIVWDDLPERSPDPYYRKVASDPESPGHDPKYLEYDFQGYIVYKSSDGSTWDLMTQCDIGDDIPAESTLSYPPGGDSSLPDSMWIEMANTGLFYNVLDEEVINGFNYYYSVTAYDWNYITDSVVGSDTFFHPLILRSGIVSNYFTMPRWDPVNYVDPIIEVVTMKGDTIAPAIRWYPQVVVPFEVTDEVYKVTFLGPGRISNAKTRIGYVLENKTTPDTILDTIMFDYSIGDTYAFSAGVFNGMELACTLNVEVPDKAHDSVWIESTPGNYPVEKLKLSESFTPQTAWAYRGSDYKIVWTDEPGYMTVKVYDISKGEMELGFRPFVTRGTGPEEAEGWCFANKLFGHPTDSLWDSTAQFYLCGGYIAFNYDTANRRGLEIGPDMNEIKSGDVWMVRGSKEGGTAPYYNVYEVRSTPGREDSTTQREFVVKVVPNPYIVFDAWESNSEERVVKFTHLPSRATIRIFTLSGDLVRVINHHHASEDQEFEYGGTANWDFLNDNQQLIAAGVYVYHVESDVGEYTGKLVFIH
ncbi:MAG: hypothetical protein JSU73_12595 [candidate division WOR-3 bacterium]|nr:MAG: hypothetical protein JSU73_12595 [candidate division WOR-3 bacterium]